MSFQWIFDRAESLSINRKKMVGITTARDGSVRTVSRGTLPKRFEVRVPDGIPWTELKDNIAAAEALDKISTASITIGSGAGYDWFGNDQTYTVRCIEFPEWTLFARNQVSWSGAFVFVEVI